MSSLRARTLAHDALERGVKAHAIDPVGYEWPAEIRESVPLEVWDRIKKHVMDGDLQKKYMDRFDLTFLMTEKEVAILNFLTPSGEFEYLGFTSSDEWAVAWCKDVFEYYWDKASN